MLFDAPTGEQPVPINDGQLSLWATLYNLIILLFEQKWFKNVHVARHSSLLSDLIKT